MTLTEVEILMQELGKHIHDETQIIFGTAVDSRMGNRLSVTLISSLAGEEDVAPPPAKPAKAAKVAKAAAPPAPTPEPVASLEPPIWEQRDEVVPEVVAQEEEQANGPEVFTPEVIQNEEAMEVAEPVGIEPVSSLQQEPEIEEPPPRVILPRKKPAIFKEPAVEKKPLAKQEVMQFEPVTRGRFEKSEPTIVEGQDLDVPTFLRKNVRVK
jgi:cell division protein FtsZ